MARSTRVFFILLLAASAAGCPKAPKAKSEYQKGREAQAAGNFDAALKYFENAVQADPSNASYKIFRAQMRFEAAEMHLREGIRLREKGRLAEAMNEFELAARQDPASPLAAQELRQLSDQLARIKQPVTDGVGANVRKPSVLASLPPELKPLSNSPINLRMTNDSKVIFDTVGKLAGLSMIFDPDFAARRISLEINNVSLQQALDVACLESKAFWKPVTENIVLILPDTAQKRRDFDEQVMRTFYLSNTVQPQELTEFVTGLRQLLDLKRIQQLNAQNAIVIRDTPSKIALAEKFINDLDKSRSEVLIDVQVLQASTDSLRTLGVLPGQSASVQINPYNCANTSSGCSSSSSSSSASNTITLNNLRHLNGSDYTVTLPSLTANAVLSDSNTRIIQSPEIRTVDGMTAKLKVGDRVPIATGSFSAGTSVTAASSLSSLVSTQFQYIDVGVNLDVTPRVHPNGEISLKVAIEVSSVTNYVTIGSIQQPVISQRKIEHDIRLREGETNILGGLFQRTDTKSLNGWPGLAKVPFMRYLFSNDNKDKQENDVLIILTPHIVRNQEFTSENLKPVFTGTETNVAVYSEGALRTPSKEFAMNTEAELSNVKSPIIPAPATSDGSAPKGTHSPEQIAQMKITPSESAFRVGEIQSLSIAIHSVSDLFSVPLLIKYDPSMLKVDDVRNGGFLSGGEQEIAIIQRNDTERGELMISAIRQPNSGGIKGSGNIFDLAIKALAPGKSKISIVQVNAKDSKQRKIPLITQEATILVQP
jgi:general secretion pathway protein D